VSSIISYTDLQKLKKTTGYVKMMRFDTRQLQ